MATDTIKLTVDTTDLSRHLGAIAEHVEALRALGAIVAVRGDAGHDVTIDVDYAAAFRVTPAREPLPLG